MCGVGTRAFLEDLAAENLSGEVEQTSTTHGADR